MRYDYSHKTDKELLEIIQGQRLGSPKLVAAKKEMRKRAKGLDQEIDKVKAHLIEELQEQLKKYKYLTRIVKQRLIDLDSDDHQIKELIELLS